jgi:hypothetical protein
VSKNEPASQTTADGVLEAVVVAVAVAEAVAVAVAVLVRQLERSPPPPLVPGGHGVHPNDPDELYSSTPQLKQPPMMS